MYVYAYIHIRVHICVLRVGPRCQATSIYVCEYKYICMYECWQGEDDLDTVFHVYIYLYVYIFVC